MKRHYERIYNGDTPPYVLIGVCIAITLAKNVGEKNDSEKEDKKDTNHMLLGMCLGAVVGLFAGTHLFQNQAIGTTMGMCVGLTIGSFIR